MARAHKPRSGSLQYWHRVRAKRAYPKIRSWPKSEKLKLLGFAGYKVGMTHTLIKDTNPYSPTKNESIFCPVTVLECPPLKVFSIRFYKKTDFGLKIITEIISKKHDKDLARKIRLPKKTKEEDINKILENTSEIRILVYTQPRLAKIGKKKPEIFELSISGEDTKEKYDFAQKLLDKEIHLHEIFKEGQFVDVHAVTKGKGLQGAVKRFGVSLKAHKSEKKRRSAGNLGSWTPKKVSWRVPQKGQMGFHNRVDYNKQVLMISSDLEKINPKAGFVHYGSIKNDYLLLKGSVPGPCKRLIRLTDSIRDKKERPVEIDFIRTHKE